MMDMALRQKYSHLRSEKIILLRLCQNPMDLAVNIL